MVPIKGVLYSNPNTYILSSLNKHNFSHIHFELALYGSMDRYFHVLSFDIYFALFVVLQVM